MSITKYPPQLRSGGLDRETTTGLGFSSFVPPRILHPNLLVLVHGMSSTSASILDRFLPIATERGIALLAPDFTTGIFRGYQRLRGRAGPLAAAEALSQVAAGQAARLGLDPQRIDLAGFSGGAQFAHRYALVFPRRVRRLVTVAAGWYTECDEALPFPEGLGGLEVEIDQLSFLHLPKLVVVGADDSSRDANLRRSEALDRRQGRHRLERARFWFDHLQAQAAALGVESHARFELLPGTGHSLRDAIRRGGLAQLIADDLADRPARPLGEEQWPGDSNIRANDNVGCVFHPANAIEEV